MTPIIHLSRQGLVAAARLSAIPRNTRSLFGFSWFGADKVSWTRSDGVPYMSNGMRPVSPPAMHLNILADACAILFYKSNTPGTSNSAPTPSTPPKNASTLQSTSTPTSDHHGEKKAAAVAKASALAKRDEEVRQKLLDMDGGSAGFEFEDGKPAGGQGRETKRNMFRIM